MPFFTIHTNAKLKHNTEKEFLEAAADLIAQELNKPKSYIVVTLDYDPKICFGGSMEIKGVLADLRSIGFSNKSGLAKLLAEFLFDRLEKLDLNAINIQFIDISPKDLAIGGTLLG